VREEQASSFLACDLAPQQWRRGASHLAAFFSSRCSWEQWLQLLPSTKPPLQVSVLVTVLDSRASLDVLPPRSQRPNPCQNPNLNPNQSPCHIQSRILSLNQSQCPVQSPNLSHCLIQTPCQSQSPSTCLNPSRNLSHDLTQGLYLTLNQNLSLCLNQE
jgi:hypothetical protein